MSDYRVTVKVRNANILNAIEAEGFKSVSAFCRFWELPIVTINALITFRHKPMNDNGILSGNAQKLCAALCVLPEDLWTDEQLYMKLPRCTSHVDISEDELETTIRQLDAKRVIKMISNRISKREKDVVNARSREETFNKIGEVCGVSRERIRQIEMNAHRKMRRAAYKLNLPEAVE